MLSPCIYIVFAGGGSGLGLYITKSIVDMHAGSVGLESEGLGSGCYFFFNIPVYRLSKQVSDVETSGVPLPKLSSAEQSYFHDRTILICDDSDLARKMLRKYLIGKGCKECYEAKNGLEALDMIHEWTEAAADGVINGDKHPVVDFILMDYIMPVLQGPEATQRIRELGFTNPIIGVTGNLADEDITQFVTCGADAVLSKPLEMPKLEHLLQELTSLCKN
jgi:CheY-like chemotaxis protein